MDRKRLIFAIFLTSSLIFALSSFGVGESHPDSSYNYNNDDLYDIEYFELINKAFELKSSEKQLLNNNKFVVLNRMGTEDILDAYKFYWENELPIFITTDTMLHTWHLIFDYTLKKLEEKIFYPLLSELADKIALNALMEYNNNFLMEDTLIYLIVASELANSTYSELLPPDIKNASEKILNAIMDEISLESAISQFDTELTRRFIDDFSQYKPRGHYIHSETLQNYFRLFKWFSRIPFFFDDYLGIVFLQTIPNDMIKSALEITWLLKGTSIRWFENYVSGLEIWNIFKSFLDVIVGQTNSISPLMIDDICKDLIGDLWNISDIDDNLITQVQANVLNDTTIPEPRSPYIIDARAGAFFSPKTFVLFGERLTLDSYALNHFVYPYISLRFLPTSLDFAAACLESDRSFELLTNEFDKYPGLLEQILEMQEEIGNLTGLEKQTAHWQWIESLKNIAVTEPECNGSIILPEFMNSSAWLDEKLTTIMGSWTQLKHDMILYSRLSLTPISLIEHYNVPIGYVEPYPEFYRTLNQLSQLYNSSIKPLETIGYNFSTNDYDYLWALDNFYEASVMLETISYKELKGSQLTEEEKQFIKSTYGEDRISGDKVVVGWLGDIIRKLDRNYGKIENWPNTRTSLVADIHTDTNTGDILHLATGLLEPLIAIVPGWDGEDITVAGPVFSFYEFNLSDYTRLNDYEWRGILQLWLEGGCDSCDFERFQRGFWAESYMVSTEITTSMIYYDNANFEPPEWFVSGPSPEGTKNNISSYNILIILAFISVIFVIIVVKRKSQLIN